MAYSKQTWDTTSYVNPTRMNHIEDGIEECSQNEVLTKTVTLTIPANQTGGTILTSAVFDNTYKLISFNLNYNDDFYYYVSSHTPYFAFLPNSRQIALRNAGGNVGDTVARTLEFNVSYKKA